MVFPLKMVILTCQKQRKSDKKWPSMAGLLDFQSLGGLGSGQVGPVAQYRVPRGCRSPGHPGGDAPWREDVCVWMILAYVRSVCVYIYIYICICIYIYIYTYMVWWAYKCMYGPSIMWWACNCMCKVIPRTLWIVWNLHRTSVAQGRPKVLRNGNRVVAIPYLYACLPRWQSHASAVITCPQRQTNM